MPHEKKLFIPTVTNNGHLKELTKFFGELSYAPIDIPENAKFFFICFTNRCGSNYFAELLASDQTLAIADETLNADTVIRWSKEKGFKSLHEYFSFLVKKIIKNNYVGIKIAPYQIEILGKSGILDQIKDRSHFIVVERSDKLAQAISHLIAFQTGKFRSIQSDADVKVEPEFSREKLDGITGNIANMYRDFNLFFSRNGITPVSINYEQLIAQPVRTLTFVGKRIGLPNIKLNPSRLRLERQAGPLNEEWRARYLTPANG